MEEANSFLVLTYYINILGLAIYERELRRFTIIKDVYDTDNCDILKSIIYKLDVDCILLSLDIDNNRFENISEMNIDIKLIEKSSIKKMKVDFLNEREYILSLSCLNALLKHLSKNELEFIDIQSKRIIEEKNVHGDNLFKTIGHIDIYSVDLMEFNSYLYINNETLQSLSIFKTKNHPHLMIKSKSEDISLFKRINYTSTSFGAQLLRNWLLFPLKDANMIEKRRDKIEYIIKNSISKKLGFHLKKCKDIRNKLINFNPNNKKQYFIDLQNFLINGKEILSLIKNDIECEFINTLLHIIEENIDLNIGTEFIINQNIDKNLDNLKNLYDNLPNYLNEVALKVNNEYEIEVTIVYFPQIGYLIETEYNIESLESKFVALRKNYYKNSFMETLDVELGDVLNKIKDIENNILINIKANIEMYKHEILNLIHFLAETDCLNSLALAAKKYNMKKPIIVNNKKAIEIQGFRNILYDGVFKRYQERDIFINNTTIITGANGSGKSSFLKEIGINIILNQIGSFLPCQRAELSLFDKLFTKISSIESVSNKRSAFMSDIIQINNVFKFATENSIFLADEFGKGTNIIDGTSLFFSVVNNSKKYISVFTTHFQDFISKNILKDIDFIYLNSFIVEAGIYSIKQSTEILKELAFNDDFIVEYNDIKEMIKNGKKSEKKRDDSWANKIINEFMASI